jgi:hypothetical protein
MDSEKNSSRRGSLRRGCSDAYGTIGSKPPDVVASAAISQLRNVIAETPQDRENAANRWPLDAKAANKASFSFDE